MCIQYTRCHWTASSWSDLLPSVVLWSSGSAPLCCHYHSSILWQSYHSLPCILINSHNVLNILRLYCAFPDPSWHRSWLGILLCHGRIRSPQQRGGHQNICNPVTFMLTECSTCGVGLVWLSGMALRTVLPWISSLKIPSCQSQTAVCIRSLGGRMYIHSHR